MPTEPDAATSPARVVLLAGPSGCGKSHLARTLGLPILALDDFYRDESASLPRRPDGLVDWEDPATWDGDAALDALDALCRHDEVEVPTYSFADNRAVGRHIVERGDSPLVVAEGIFAAELIAPLAQAGLLADVFLVQQRRWVTFGRRLLRDLREHRKSPLALLRHGWAKTRTEPTVVARHRRLGARPHSKADVRRRVAHLRTQWIKAMSTTLGAATTVAGASEAGPTSSSAQKTDTPCTGRPSRTNASWVRRA